jgi:hypothetical protein
MMRRVKITKLPEAGYGRPISEGWSTKNKNGYTASLLSDKTSSPVRKTLTSVPREEANVEAEGGETVVGDFQKDGLDEFYNIQGPRHADGPGVPLNLPESFIFSDTKKMRINNPDLLKIFGKSKGSYTPAALSKRYQLNDYNAKLLDKDTDTLEKETAELMINNNRDKLSKLAIIQEVYLKGGNVPKFAFPYLEKKGINTSQLATDQDDINEEQYRYGGYLSKAQTGKQIKTAKKTSTEQPIYTSPIADNSYIHHGSNTELRNSFPTVDNDGAFFEQGARIINTYNNGLPNDTSYVYMKNIDRGGNPLTESFYYNTGQNMPDKKPVLNFQGSNQNTNQYYFDAINKLTGLDSLNKKKIGGYLHKAQVGKPFKPPVDARPVDKFSEGYNPYAEDSNYAYKDTPGYKVPTDQKTNFTPADILQNQGKFSTFHRLAKEAGIANDPVAMEAAAKDLHKYGKMPTIRKTEVLKTAQPAPQSTPTPNATPASSNCPPGHMEINGNCVNIQKERVFPGGEGGGDAKGEYVPTTVAGKEQEKQTYDYSQYPSQPFFKSDVVDLYGSAFSLFDNTDVGPTYQRVAGPRTINPVLEDPTRAIANRQEGAARATDAIKAFGRNPSSAASYMQGLAAGDTANIISGVNQRNIGTLNQTQGFNAQMLGNYDRMRQMADRQYDVDLATYLQQKANTRAQKRNVFTNKLSQAYTNQGNVNLLNAQDPSFMFSTRANNIRFTGQPGNEEASTETGFTRKNTANMSPDELERYEKELSIRDIESRIASRNQLGYVPRRGGAGWRQQAGLPGSRQ